MRTAPERARVVQACELALLDPEVRRDAQRVDRLLHPEFVEIGRSGHRWSRAEIVAALAQEHGRVVPETDEWQFDDISPALVLVTYRIRSASGTSRHASLWDLSGGAPVIRYHQETVMPEV